MKKTILFISIFSLGLLLHAQTAITFESAEIGSTGGATALWGGGSVEVVANPYTDGINTSDKSLRVVSNDYLTVFFDLELPEGTNTNYPYLKVRYKLCYISPNGEGDDFKYPNTDFYSLPGSTADYMGTANLKGDLGWNGSTGSVGWGDPTPGTWTQHEFAFEHANENIPAGFLAIKIAKPTLEYLIDDIELVPVPDDSAIFTAEDFESYALNDVLDMKRWNTEDGTATIEADPTNASNQVVHIVTSNFDALLKLNVVLPTDRIVKDYVKIMFDIYSVSGASNNYKQMHIYIDGNRKYEDSGYPTQAPDQEWITKEYDIDNWEGDNSFVLDLGISTDGGNYYIDNIRLLLDPITNVSNPYLTPLIFTNNKSTIFLNQIADNVQLFDINGRMIINNNHSSTVNIESLSSGVYIIKASIEGNNFVTKIIK